MFRLVAPPTLATGLLCGLVSVAATPLARQAAPPPVAPVSITFAEAKPVLDALRDEVLPRELRGRSTDEREAVWADWVSRRDAAIRARVEEGDADSIINLLQFGTSFTKQPRITEQAPAGVQVRQAGTGITAFVPSPVLVARINDFVAALASPGENERLQFARAVIERKGMDLATAAGRDRVRRYLEERTEVVGSAPHAATLFNPDSDLRDLTTIFRDRGLASDTAIWIDFGIERALEGMTARGLVTPGSIRRIAVLGPGLDFADKQEGHDFYPEQTLQPFALIDSLSRLGLSASGGLRVTALDLSPRVLRHIEIARTRAGAGEPYVLALPRNLDQPWTPALVKYWESFGDRIGAPVAGPRPPPTAGRVTVRSVRVGPSAALAILPSDLNVVVQRLAPLPEVERFDLIVASNILIYYDVFEQSLAVANLAAMLKPGGVLLSNDRIFELPGGPVTSVGHTDVTYMELSGGRQRGDRIEWYQRR